MILVDLRQPVAAGVADEQVLLDAGGRSLLAISKGIPLQVVVVDVWVRLHAHDLLSWHFRANHLNYLGASDTLCAAGSLSAGRKPAPPQFSEPGFGA